MSPSDDKSIAVVVLPAIGDGRLQDLRLRRWLARSSLQRTSVPKELLASILDVLGVPCPAAGLGAVRLWGQTGERPTVWIAAAEPVYLEPRLDHLCLHSQQSTDVPLSDLRPLFDHLQRSLAQGTGIGFARIGSFGYLRANEEISTANVPAYVVDQQLPDRFMPSGEDAASYRNLISEVEMALHDHEVNQQRQASGLYPINSLWFWGGGMAPEQQNRRQLPLFSNDPLLKGYWYSNTAVAASWPGSIAACLQASVAGFVAVVPDSANDIDQLQDSLSELREALRSGRLSRLILMFRDGIKADIVRKHSLRFWRRTSALLD